MSMAENALTEALKETGSTWISEKELSESIKKRGTNIRMKDILSSPAVIAHEDDGEMWYTTRKINEYECMVAVHVMRLLYCKACRKVPEHIIEKYVREFEEKKNQGRTLHFHQIDAVKMSVNYNFSVLTGGPGTGKTTVINAIVYVMRKLNTDIEIAFTAPTGKAATNITDATGEEAGTTYQKFGLTPQNMKALPLTEDVLFCDEVSMMDNESCAAVLSSIASGKKVVFVGDPDQLPSVGIGAILRDLIRSGCIPLTMLTHTFRQKNDSKLYGNILNIKAGKYEILEGEDYHAIALPGGQSAEIDNMAVNLLCSSYLEQVNKYGKENVVVLLPYRKKGVCSNYVNLLLQKAVNKETMGFRHEYEEEGYTVFFRKNDFVMQLENRTECVNGDIGQITEVSEEGVTVAFLNSVVTYMPYELDQLALAYAMSIHKSQGSEYASVIMCILEEHDNMLQRNLLYTGVTRAKKEVTLIYQLKAYQKAVSTIADENRKTFLVEKLINLKRRYCLAYGV